jgi:enediyne biosynthesis thioesterase
MRNVRAFRYHHVVTLDETNLVGNVYFAHYLHWQGHCRELFLAEHAPGVLAALKAGRFAMVTVSCGVDFYAECFALDEVEVTMTLRAASGNRIEMDFDYHRRGTLAARGRQTVACVAREGDHVVPTEIPADLARAVMSFA